MLVVVIRLTELLTQGKYNVLCTRTMVLFDCNTNLLITHLSVICCLLSSGEGHDNSTCELADARCNPLLANVSC